MIEIAKMSKTGAAAVEPENGADSRQGSMWIAIQIGV
jgi:hypothetical protein